MRWRRGHRSDDVEIRRSGGGPGALALLGPVARIFGVGGVLVLLAVVLVGRLACGESFPLLGGGGGGEPAARVDDERVEFVSFVLDDAQATWEELFRARGLRYQRAKLAIFRGSTPTGCGRGSAAIGPFYCPLDRTVYIDLGFYEQLQRRFGAPGDFAQAYVIAHEIGHHVQHQLGALGGDRGSGPDSASVRTELQADCLAGVWAHSTGQRDLLERGDVEEALRAASAIGDDALQRQSGGVVRPESWTHGSSEQRVRWFRRGLERGRLDDCDTRSGPL